MEGTIDIDGIESTFEETDRFSWAHYEFEGMHTGDDRRIAQQYVVEHGNDFLEEIVRYYHDGDLVRERSNYHAVDVRDGSVPHVDCPIGTFCRERHLTDLESQFGLFPD